jgi:hypothetical protein
MGTAWARHATCESAFKWHTGAQNVSLCCTFLFHTTGYSVVGNDGKHAVITGSSQTDIQGQSYAGLDLDEFLSFMTRRPI